MTFQEKEEYVDTNGEIWNVKRRTKSFLFIKANYSKSTVKKKIKKDVFGNEIIEFNCRYPFNITSLK